MAQVYRFFSDFMPDPSPRVLAFTCDEQVGRPYNLSVYADSNVEPSALEGALGKRGTLSIHPEAEGRTVPILFHGVLLGADLLVAVGGRRIYRLALAPALRVLDLGHHSRVFVDQSVPEVIEAILRTNELTAYELRLSARYAKRPHVCQYKESDLAFLHRWMEREGIYYYFLQEQDGERLVICDDKSRHDAAPSHVRYHASGGANVLSRESFHTWRRVHAAVTEAITFGDYDYQRPALLLERTSSRAAIGFETLVRFEDNLQDDEEADRLASVRAESLRAAQVRFDGRGRVGGLSAGLCFELEDHPRGGFNQRYQLYRVIQHGSLVDADDERLQQLLPAAEDGYHVDVEALPSSVQYRSPRCTPWPQVHGVESALIDAIGESSYPQIDSEGRYRVRLLFDEKEGPGGSASAWVRMLQPHGGATETQHFPLRKGTEVLVAFVHGDPDRPYILGAAPTRTTPSTVTSANGTQNVIQTGSLNRFEIEDLEGRQYIDLSTPPQSTFLHLGAHAGLGHHNIVVSTRGDGLHNAAGMRDLTVGGDQTEDVVGDVVEEYGANQRTHVVGALTETIDSGMTQTIAASSTQSIDGGLTQSIAGGETRTVDGSSTETISGGRTQTIVGSTTETVGGSLTQAVGGFADISTPASYVLNAAAGITMMTPANGKLTGIGGVTVIAPGGHMTVDALYNAVGKQHLAQYFLKLTIGLYRFSATPNWRRVQQSHVAVLGLKVDYKVVEVKNVPIDEKLAALHSDNHGTSVKKNGTTQMN